MQPHKLPNAAASVLTISTTAVDLATAITSAGGVGYTIEDKFDAVDLIIESESIRWLDDGNTPTASNGHLAVSGVLSLRGDQVKKFQMIRAGSADATVTVRIGVTNYKQTEDKLAASTTSVDLTNADIQIGAVEIKDGDTDTRLDVELDTAKNAAFVQSETLATEAKQDATIAAIDDAGFVSTDNSTATPLLANITYTGTWEDVSDYASLSVSVVTDQIGTLYIDSSSDGVNLDRSLQLSDGTTVLNALHTIVTITQFYRIRLVNGTADQTYLRLQTIFNRGARIAMPTSRLEQTLNDYTDVLNTRSALVVKQPDGTYQNTDVQHPLPTDGDQVYAKDVDTSRSLMNGFSGAISDLFDDSTTVSIDSTATNPKEIEIWFNRGIALLSLAIGSFTGSFSNLKIIALFDGGIEVPLFDESTDNTDKTADNFTFTAQGAQGIKLQFHTADAVSISSITISKTITALSRIQGKRDDGEYQELKSTNEGLFKVLSHSFDLAVIEGDVPGHAIFEKYGRNSDIDTGSAPEDIWNGEGEYTGFPTGSAETLEIRSDDTSDTSGGTGARTVTITGLLDGSYNEMPDVTVTLNGTSWVSLGAQTYLRCSRAVVVTAGSSGHNEGELTIRHTTTTANIFAVMPALQNQTAIAAYTVPLGKTLYIKRVNFQMARANGSAGSATMSFRARAEGEVFQTKLSPEITSSSNYTFENNGFLQFAAKTDVKCRCDDVSDNNTIVTGEFSGFLIDD